MVLHPGLGDIALVDKASGRQAVGGVEVTDGKIGGRHTTAEIGQ